MHTHRFKRRIKSKFADASEYFGLVLGLILLGFPGFATGATFYVAQNSVNPTPPYAGWSTAATNIQDAINAAGNGDQVLVTNGTYAYGGLAMSGTLTNRVALNKALAVQSVNGPWVTFILGAGATNGANAVRCAWLTNGAALTGFTLTAGATAQSGIPNIYGGGVWCAATNAIVANCVIVSNTAFGYGGGAYQGDLQNCLVANNTSSGQGSGAAYANLTSCTVVYNGGYGVWFGNCTNCIIYYSGSADYHGSGNLVYCCSTSANGGPGNFTSAPQLFADEVHLLAGSPCIGAGINLVTGTDIFGRAWNNPPSIGCAEWTPTPVVTSPQIQLLGNPTGFALKNAAVAGQAPLSFSWLQNGMPLADNGHFSGSLTTNLTASGVIGSDAGSYQLVVSNALGVVTSSVANLVIHFVAAGGANPTPPYTSWATAATNIQSAVTAAAAGDVVLVTNGVYATGGISMDGVITNVVSVNKAILVQSVNGPTTTIIQGAWDPTTTNGPGAVRCAWLTNSAYLGGFTLRGGATRGGSGLASTDGGGIYASSTNAWAYNCVITANAAYLGGGAYKGSLFHCTLAGNQATSYGGGDYEGNLENCVITGNVALQSNGGGTGGCHATNCAYLYNSSIFSGGAADSGTLVNCTITENTSSGYSSGYGGAVSSATLVNCIVYGNLSRTAYTPNYNGTTMTYCDTDPLPAGTGNLDVNPQLLADGIHLAATSPVIGQGNAAVVAATDIDGQPWNNPPSIGCDEWQPAPVATSPVVQLAAPAYGVTLSTFAAGEGPFTFVWSLNGKAIQDNGHYTSSTTASLAINHVSLADAGFFQVAVSNALGVVTSPVVPLVVHVVNAAGNNPVPPYTSWAMAATNIQDAVNAAAAGDIVLVTNGLYAAGGAVAVGMTNRVVVNLPISLIGINGSGVTTIQGAWDPATTNGPNAVRGVVLADGAVLTGFTIRNGATLGKAEGNYGFPLQSGGGVLCNSTNGTVVDCVLSNNAAMYGGGIWSGTLNNSLLVANQAVNYFGSAPGSGGEGGGAYGTTLNNCTVTGNYVQNLSGVVLSNPVYGAGVYAGLVHNSIVLYDVDQAPQYNPISDNCDPSTTRSAFVNNDTTPAPAGNGNLNNVAPQWVDAYHLGLTSPCRGAGSAAYASGVDLDGQVWANPPSMGCSEVVPANLGGPLAVSLTGWPTGVYTARPGLITATVTGRATRTTLAFGDGQVVANAGLAVSHIWTQAGNFPITFTAYNNDNPAGVSAGAVAQIAPLIGSPLQPIGVTPGGFQFQFQGVQSAWYTIQYTTNLSPPVIWNTLATILYSSGAVQQITDPAAASTRFYRVLAR